MLKLVLSAAACAAVCSPAFAQDFYAGLGYQYIETDDSSGDDTYGLVTGHLGYNLNSWLSVEGEVGLGVEDETIATPLAGDVDIGVNYLVGAYGRANFPVGERVRLFARAGVVNGETETSFQGSSISQSGTGFGLGAGGEVMLSERFGLRGEYTRYDIDDMDMEANAYTISAIVKF